MLPFIAGREGRQKSIRILPTALRSVKVLLILNCEYGPRERWKMSVPLLRLRKSLRLGNQILSQNCFGFTIFLPFISFMRYCSLRLNSRASMRNSSFLNCSLYLLHSLCAPPSPLCVCEESSVYALSQLSNLQFIKPPVHSSHTVSLTSELLPGLFISSHIFTDRR